MSCVDVIIPCYRYAHFLRDCVKSVLSQEGVDIRILILDDCSPDNTPEVAAELQQQDSRIEYRRHEKNQGHIATYNEGLEWTNGDYVMLLSADDLLISGALARAARLMDAYPEVGLVYGKQIVFRTGQLMPTVPLEQEEMGQILSGLEFLEQACTTATNNVPTPTAVVRTVLQKRLGGYRPELPHSGDMEMWLRFAANASIGVLNTWQAYYRLHNQNMRYSYLGVKDIQQRKDAFDTLFREYGHHLSNKNKLQEMSNQSLAEVAFWEASRAFDRAEVHSCQELLDFAVVLHPLIRSSRMWMRLRIKRFLGPRVWSLVQPTVDRFRKLIRYRSTVH